MKKCSNPFNEPHSKRKKVPNHKVAGELLNICRSVFPLLDWSGDQYLCTGCDFKVRKKAAQKTIAAVAKVVNVARKSTSKSTSKLAPPEKPAHLGRAEVGPRQLSTSLNSDSDNSQGGNFPQPSRSEHEPIGSPGPSSGFPSAPPRSPSLSTVGRSSPSDLLEEPLPTMFQPLIGVDTGSRTSSIVSSAPSASIPVPSEVPSGASSLMRLEAEHSLDTTLGTMNVTPVRHHGRSSMYAVKKTYQKATAALKGKFETLTNKQFEISPNPKEKSCFFCNTLLDELSQRFPTLPTKSDKYKLLTCIPKRFNINEVQQKFAASIYMIRNASRLRSNEGAFSAPTFHYGHPLSEELRQLVKDFYLSPDNSRPSPRQDETISIKNALGQKERVAKHRILSNLSDLYVCFKQSNPGLKISESKFATLRPKNCVWPGRRGTHNTCVCEIHQNFEFMLEALGTNETITTFIQKTVCDPSTSECYNGLCIQCPNLNFIHGQFLNLADEEEVEFMQWKHTDSTDINKVTMSVDEFRAEFKAAVPKIIEHDYVYRRQRDFIRTLRDHTLQEQTGITIHVDFAQNYTFLIQNAVQGFHWSNRQATIHPFVVHWWCNEGRSVEFRTYCVISNEMAHDADTFHAFRSHVLEKIREDLDFLDLRTIYYISDGAAGQYKNFKNFANLMHHEEDFGIRAEWHFTATAHGKSTCDAISGVVKSVTRIESLKPGVYITNAEEMYSFCSKKLTTNTLKMMYIDKTAVSRSKDALAARYRRYKTIPGTRRYHMFRPENNIMAMKLTSSSESTMRYNFILGETTLFTLDGIQIGTCYVFYHSSNYQIGMAVDKIEDEGEILLQAYKLNRRNGKMEFPNPGIFLEVPLRDVFSQVSDPITADGKIYTFADNEFDAVKASYRTFRSNR